MGNNRQASDAVIALAERGWCSPSGRVAGQIVDNVMVRRQIAAAMAGKVVPNPGEGALLYRVAGSNGGDWRLCYSEGVDVGHDRVRTVFGDDYEFSSRYSPGRWVICDAGNGLYLRAAWCSPAEIAALMAH